MEFGAAQIASDGEFALLLLGLGAVMVRRR
jgi:hypothetical protein